MYSEQQTMKFYGTNFDELWKFCRGFCSIMIYDNDPINKGTYTVRRFGCPDLNVPVNSELTLHKDGNLTVKPL